MNNNHITLSGFVWKHIKKYKISFFFMFFLYGFLSLERVYFPYLVGNIIDIMSKLTDKNNWWAEMSRPLITIVVIMFAMDVIFRVQDLITEYVLPRFKANMRREAFEYVMGHSNRFFAEHHVGSTGSKIETLVQSIANMLGKIIHNFSPVTLTLIISCITIYTINSKIGFIYLIWIIAHMAVTIFTANSLQKSWKHWAEKNNIVRGKVIDSINNILSVRLFFRQKEEVNYYIKYQDDEIKASFDAGLAAIYVRIVLGVMSSIGISTLIYFMIHEWQIDKLSIGGVTAGFSIVVNTLLLMWWMSSEMVYFYMDVGSAKEAMSLLSTKHEISNIDNAKDLIVKNENSSIEFKNVSFGYNNKLFFDNLNIKIKAGEKVGLVGFSGAGKTTFANLIMREFDIQKGEILINNQDIKNVTLSSLRNNISYITQDISMFHRTVMENIRFGDDKISDEEVIKASKDACCHDFIIRLDKEYETLVGEKGAKLSGGQKQRVSIARAILRNSPIIILDEATSALDSVTEQKIKEAIERLAVGRTTLIIAHRLSTLREVDRIIVFENGAIIEDGSHDELVQKEDGYYRTLWESQNDYYDVNDDWEAEVEEENRK